MTPTILGMSKESFYTLLFIVLLVILGIVSFHFYYYVSGENNISAGIGAGFTLFPSQPHHHHRARQEMMRHQEMMH